MTESSPVTHAIPVDRDDIDRSPVGLLLSGTEAQLLDTVAEVTVPSDGVSEHGEILNRPDGTAEMLDAGCTRETSRR